MRVMPRFSNSIWTAFALVWICAYLIYPERAVAQTNPAEIQFVRQGVKRLIFAEDQAISLSSMDPKNIVGIATMHPTRTYSVQKPQVEIQEEDLVIRSPRPTESVLWLGGFNPFATYYLDLKEARGACQVGFEFSDPQGHERFIVSVQIRDDQLLDARLRILIEGQSVFDQSILVELPKESQLPGKIILQMLGSGLNLLWQKSGRPHSLGQVDFSEFLDLRKKKYLASLQANLYFNLSDAKLLVGGAESALTTGLGQADIRAITYKDGTPLFDQGRLWYTMSIRGRALPHHLQGVFSLDPSVFDVKLEGIIVFDRNDGLLRNEISSHIFYDEKQDTWLGLTTGFSAFAQEGEEKQILAIESKKDPRFGFSIMRARTTGIVGDIEDSHILYDEDAQKWRILTCEQREGYKAIILESDHWDREYKLLSGPVLENSTGTSIQKIGDQRYCFAGSSERAIFIYSYPDLEKIGTLKMDLPPWDPSSRTRVWPNVVQLPDGYPARYIALMMDRYNYPGQKGPHWSYGALYLYFGFEKS